MLSTTTSRHILWYGYQIDDKMEFLMIEHKSPIIYFIEGRSLSRHKRRMAISYSISLLIYDLLAILLY